MAAVENPRILIAEDDRISRLVLQRLVGRFTDDLAVAESGSEAWEILSSDRPPVIAFLDWMMPGMSGVDICRRVRETPELEKIYLILVTANSTRDAVVEGLTAGADDFIVKPFDSDELVARLNAGRRIVELQSTLSARVNELEAALAQVKQLKGLLPMCAYCRKVRDDQNYWQQVEQYISTHTEAQVSHGICPDCYTEVVERELGRRERRRARLPETPASGDTKR
jgi:sigma-B regulation protein RsbU (phosphoserine phosphatase)